MICTLRLSVQLENRIVLVDFVVCDQLVGTDFSDKFVESIRPRRKQVKLVDGTVVQIRRGPLVHPPNALPLPRGT